ncbi:MAG: hypothetical protein NTZ80_00860 [Patescibacteria group bacterium]|nr:hypothetical protein [Patescibacteria group bacterium]
MVYDGYVKDSGIRKGDFFVIAICSDFEDFDERCILNTLFSLGKTIYRRSKNGNLEGPFYEYCPSIEKHNGVDISTNIFESDDYRNLSGIIYSSRRVIDIIDDSKWKDFYFCFNPKAINHLERMDFNFCRHIYKKNGLVSMKICDS